MKTTRLIITVIGLVGIVGIGSVILFLLNRDPLLSSHNGPSSATYSLRQGFNPPPIGVTPETLSQEEQLKAAQQEVIQTDSATAVPSVEKGGLSTEDMVKSPEVAPAVEVKEDFVEAESTKAGTVEFVPPAVPAVDHEDASEQQPKYLNSNIFSGANVAVESQEIAPEVEPESVESIDRPVVLMTSVDASPQPHTLVEMEISLQKAPHGTEVFPYLKRYQANAFSEACVLEDKRRSKGDAVRDFKKALQFGGFCEQNSISSDVKIMFEAIYEVFSDNKPKFFIEYSSGSVKNSIAHMVSFTWPWLLVMFHQLPVTQKSNGLNQNPIPSSASVNDNLAYCHNSVPSNVITVKEGGEGGLGTEQMDCFQFVEGYEDYAVDMLPFELEEYLGHSICRCNVTWLPINLPQTAYFTVWGNSTDLLAAAMATVAKKCSYDVHVPSRPVYAGRNKPMSTVETHIRVHRVLIKEYAPRSYDLIGGSHLSDTTSLKSPMASYSSYRSGSRASYSSPTSPYNKKSSSSYNDIGTVATEKSVSESTGSGAGQPEHELTFQDLMSLDLQLESKVLLLSSFASSSHSIKHCISVELDSRMSSDCRHSENSLPTLYIRRNGEIDVRSGETTKADVTAAEQMVKSARSTYASNRDDVQTHVPSSTVNLDRLSDNSTWPSVVNSTEFSPTETPGIISRRLTTSFSQNDKDSGGGAKAGFTTTLNSASSTVSTTSPVSSSLNSYKSPTKKPSSSPNWNSKTSSSSSTTGVASSRDTIIDDIEHRFSASPQTSRAVSFSSTTSSAKRDYIDGSNIKRTKADAQIGRDFSQWLFSGDFSALQKNIEESVSEKDGIFNEWVAAQGSSINQSNGFSFANSPNLSGATGDADEMSELGRANMRDLRDRERAVMKKWVSTLHNSLQLNREHVVRSDSINIHKLRAAPEDRKMTQALKNSKLAKSEVVMVFGRHVSMLSIKLAQILRPGGLVVSVHTDTTSISSHNDLITMFNLNDKNMVCFNKMSILDVVALSGSQELASVSIYQTDVAVRLLASALTTLIPRAEHALSAVGSSRGDDDLFETIISHDKTDVESESSERCAVSVNVFEESIGVLLDLSKTTYMELPSLERFNVIIEALSSECALEFSRRYNGVEDILSRSIKTISNHVGSMKVNEISGGSDGIGAPTVFAIRRIENGEHTDSIPHIGLSLYRLLHLHPSQQILKTAFNLFLDAPFWLLKSEKSKIVLPWNLFVSYENGAMSLKYYFSDEGAGDSFPLMHHHQYNADIKHPGETGNKRSKPSFGAISPSRRKDDNTMKSSIHAANDEKSRAHYMFDVLDEELKNKPGDLAAGRFSFVEHNSGFGFLSTLVSAKYPNATVISLEADAFRVNHHVSMLNFLSLRNNAVCNKKRGEDSTMYKNIYESPELFRFQIMSQGFLESFRDSDNLYKWGADVGSLLSTALSTFVHLPTSDVASLSMYLFFGSFDVSIDGFGRGPVRSMKEIYGDFIFDSSAGISDEHMKVFQASCLNPGSLKCEAKASSTIASSTAHLDGVSEKIRVWSHPFPLFEEFESSLLLIHSRALAGNTRVRISPLHFGENKLRSSLTRIDVINMTRGVHHHYDYAKDGHKRTYTMRVMVNDTATSQINAVLGSPSRAISSPTRNEVTLLYKNVDGSPGRVILPPGSHPNSESIVTVNLMRASTIPFYIPYTSIYGVTLITALRLGLETSQRDRMFSSFINLPLYEDMAPWNIVLMGQGLDYIDYDTRDITFDKFVPKAYQVMSVLMNYKRTVEDFKRCGAKASTVYGIAFISDCVGNTKGLKCDELSHAVPCPDGECHTDYISCLRSLTYQANALATESASDREDSTLKAMADAMSAQTGQFDENGFVNHAIRFL